MIQSLYLNLPVKDVAATRKFWSNLGFTFNEHFSDEKALCLMLQENLMYVMFVHTDYFKTFTNRPIYNGSTTQQLCALQVESKAKVDELVKQAIELGATTYRDPIDHGWMYQSSFADLDGHQWEFMFADLGLLNNVNNEEN